MEKMFLDISILAQKALAYEVLLTPKPGLVDRRNNGSHDDMDMTTFMDSILVLREYFYGCLESGYNFKGEKFSELMNLIRPIGIRAEETMNLATGGINTHKGAIFIFGILNAAIGTLLAENKILDVEAITNRSGEIAFDILEDFNKDFSNIKNLTYGEKHFLKHGDLGIRGEAKDSFPNIKKAYKSLEETISLGYSLEIGLGEAFLTLLSEVFDSNIVGRGGLESLEFMKDSSEKIISLGGYKTQEGIKALYRADDEFIKRNISPGGCADLCAATVFLYLVKSL